LLPVKYFGFKKMLITELSITISPDNFIKIQQNFAADKNYYLSFKSNHYSYFLYKKNNAW